MFYLSIHLSFVVCPNRVAVRDAAEPPNRSRNLTDTAQPMTICHANEIAGNRARKSPEMAEPGQIP